MVYINPSINILSKSLRNIGRNILRDFSEVEKLQSSIRGTEDFSRKAIIKIKQKIQIVLSEFKPNYSFQFSDTNNIKEKSNDFFFVCPLNGFINFSHAIPHFCMSISMSENSKIVTELIYDPIKDEMFYASEGKGAYLNDSRIRVSLRSKIENSLLIVNNIEKTKESLKVKEKFIFLRETGCSNLDKCYVASGRSEALIQMNLKNNEFIPGTLIIREAGGVAENLNINKTNVFYASNIKCQNSIKEIINNM